MVAGSNDTDSDLVAHGQQAGHGRFGVGAILLLQDVKNILHEHVGRAEIFHHIIEGCDLAVPAFAASTWHQAETQHCTGLALGFMQ